MRPTQVVISEPNDVERERRRQLYQQKEELRLKRLEQVSARFKGLLGCPVCNEGAPLQLY